MGAVPATSSSTICPVRIKGISMVSGNTVSRSWLSSSHETMVEVRVTSGCIFKGARQRAEMLSSRSRAAEPEGKAMERRVTRVQALTVEQRSLGCWFIEQQPERAALYAQINHFNPSAHAFDSEAWGAAMASLMAPRNLLPLEALAGIACPTLFVVGSEDPLVPAEAMQAFAQQVADSELQVVDGAGHSAYFEKPAEFNENVLAFLKRHCPA